MIKTMVTEVDKEDAGDAIPIIGTAFKISFGDKELFHISNVGQLLEHIKSKLVAEHGTGCTSQQAFYKLRQALVTEQLAEYEGLNPSTPIDTIFPRENRRRKVKQLEKRLGFNLHILSPPDYIVFTFLGLFLCSAIVMYFNLLLGIGLLFAAIGLIWVSHKIATELTLSTVGDLTLKMARENYMDCRRFDTTINPAEVEMIIKQLVADCCNISVDELSPDTRFV